MEAEGVMKEVFLSVLSRNLESILSSITSPTLLLWGEEDNFVEIEDAHIMKKEIPNSTLVTFPGIGHTPHKNIPEELAGEIEKFLIL
ncbi:MAG TPA: alpha/beta hydrolase [Candidatus Wildermuthbacteria bacterium]|nr:alpha/beta hydrolase [Candidatus Wildermuthbacteria bacterium]